MICLGIESTAHTFGVGIVDDKGKILVNEKSVYSPEMGAGIVPADAAEHHKNKADEVLNNALNKAKTSLEEVDVVSIAIGPGLPPCLLEGIRFAKSLEKPMIGVNHCVAHIEIGKLFGKMSDPLTVYVSGGNTQITAYEKGRYRVFGETLDIGIGNAIDKFARNIGLKSPGGPVVELLARKSRNYIALPYSVKGMDLVFSGLVTAASNKPGKKEDVCYSFQETVFSMLTEVSERAIAHTEKKELLLTGGVAQNKRLQEMIKKMGGEHGARFFVPLGEYCSDNGAMIAWTGILGHERGIKEKIDAKPRWRTDEVLW